MISNIFSKTHSFYILGTSHSNYPWENLLEWVEKLKNYLKKRSFRVDFFKWVIFLTFRVDLILRTGFRWNFREDLFLRILVLYILIFRGLFYSC